MDLQSPPAFCLLAGLATPSSIQSCFPEAKVKRSLRFAATLPGFLTLEGLICYRLQQTAASVAVVSNAALVLPGGVNSGRVWAPNPPPARRTRYLLLPQAFGTRGWGTWLPALLCGPTCLACLVPRYTPRRACDSPAGPNSILPDVLCLHVPGVWPSKPAPGRPPCAPHPGTESKFLQA